MTRFALSRKEGRCEVKVGFGRRFKTLEMEFVPYDAIWEAVRAKKFVKAQPPGAGTADDPYRPTSVGEWYWLTQVDLPVEPQYMRVGSRLIARWGTAAGKQGQNYASDLTDFKDLVGAPTPDAISEVKSRMATKDKSAGLPGEGQATIYTRKAMRLDALEPQVAARAARQLLHGQPLNTDYEGELANSLCGLLICEGHKSRDNSGAAVFMATLLLLDLVEARVRYGRNKVDQQQYTWASMLMHGNSTAKPVAIAPPAKIPGRSVKGEKRDIAKHPMAGAGTVALGKSITNLGEDNAARNRVVSIGVAWMANFLWERDPSTDYQYSFVRQSVDTWSQPKIQDKSKAAEKPAPQIAYKHLKKVSEMALEIRRITTDCLVNGKMSDKVTYVDQDGKAL